jgi:hypothetical protein
LDSNSSDVFDEDVESQINESTGSTATNSNDSEEEQFDGDDDSSVCSSDNDDVSSSFQMSSIGALLSKCRSIITTIRKSSILHELVQTIATDSSIKGGLIIDMRIRWNSSFRMIQRLVVYQATLDKFYEQLNDLPGATTQQKKKLFDAKLRGDDWNLLQALRRVLERFDEATKILFGQAYATLSISYAVMFSLFHYLNCRSADTIENAIKDLLLDSYNQYIGSSRTRKCLHQGRSAVGSPHT